MKGAIGRTVLWIVVIILMFATLALGASGAQNVKEASYYTPIHISTGPVSITAISAEDVAKGEPYSDYYRLEFELTNNGGEVIRLDAYSFKMKVEGTDRYDVQFENAYESGEYQLDPVVPSGCTGMVSLLLRVDQEVASRSGKLYYSDYKNEILLDTISLA